MFDDNTASHRLFFLKPSVVDRQSENSQAALGGAPALGDHLMASIKELWRGYRKKLKRCQRDFSEESVHLLRVQTRRLLSKVDLLSALLQGACLKKAERNLKKRLDEFDSLRDTQVQLLQVGEMLREYPELTALYQRLKGRERRFIKRLAKSIKRFKADKLAELMAALRKELAALFSDPMENTRQFLLVLSAVDVSHAEVVRLRRQIDPVDTTTIHRVRVAFKRFRYMVESLRPVLSGVGRRQLQSMHDYQAMMGNIQDLEVLMAFLDKLAAKRKVEAETLRAFRETLTCRRALLVKAYVDAADQLFEFWPRRAKGWLNWHRR